MTTRTYSSVVSHANDAGFRAWGAQLQTELLAAGLVQTADTGQINWVTVTRPAVNTAAGYEIYRFSDTLQATAPIFIKIEYGASSNIANPNMWVTVGTGTNGAGTITGTSSSRVTVTSTNGLASTIIAYPSYICHKDGFLGLRWKFGAAASVPNDFGFFAICRTVDDTGAETADGFTLFYRLGPNNLSGGPLAQSVSFTNATAFTASFFYGLVHYAVTSSAVGANQQVYKCYTIQPQVRPVLHVVIALTGEYPTATTFTATPVGTTSRTFLSGGVGANHAGAQQAATHCLAILWE